MNWRTPEYLIMGGWAVHLRVIATYSRKSKIFFKIICFTWNMDNLEMVEMKLWPEGHWFEFPDQHQEGEKKVVITLK